MSWKQAILEKFNPPEETREIVVEVFAAQPWLLTAHEAKDRLAANIQQWRGTDVHELERLLVGVAKTPPPVERPVPDATCRTEKAIGIHRERWTEKGVAQR
ncbi:MAG: hypothetical protein NXI32_26965 [bacterium]|nr:hypothetical protein [bacterium]